MIFGLCSFSSHCVQLRLGLFHEALDSYTKAADLAPGISGQTPSCCSIAIDPHFHACYQVRMSIALCHWFVDCIEASLRGHNSGHEARVQNPIELKVGSLTCMHAWTGDSKCVLSWLLLLSVRGLHKILLEVPMCER